MNLDEERIAGYRLKEKIGEGGMGTVYRVVEESTGRTYAMKLLHPSYRGTAESLRFKREFRVLQDLKHPGIIEAVTHGQDRGNAFYIMEYVRGITLKHFIDSERSEGSDWIRRILSLVEQLCEALHYIHGRNMIHRDLKPSNIMLLEEHPIPRIKLLDFGLIRTPETTSLTGTGYIVGSVAYMSPEQTLGAKIDARSDLYSIGIILFEALTGRLPFDSDNPVAVLGMHQLRKPPSFREFGIRVPDIVEQLVLRLLEKNPAARFLSALLLRNAIRTVQMNLTGRTVVSGSDPGSTMPVSLLNPTFTGRTRELRFAMDWIESHCRNPVSVLMVHGEPGAGRSRFLEEFRQEVVRKEFRVGRGSFFVDDPLLFQGFSRALGDILITSPAGPVQPVEAPTINLETSVLKPSSLETLAQVLYQLIFDSPGKSPLVFFLDDFHHAKQCTIELIWKLMQIIRMHELIESQPGACMLILTFSSGHPEDASLSGFMKDLKENGTGTVIQLTRLSRQTIRQIAVSMLGADLDGKLLQMLWEASHGIPGKLHETLQHLHGHGGLDYQHGMWKLSETASTIRLHPETISVHRQEEISLHSRTLMEAAAVINQPVNGTILRNLCRLTEQDYLNALTNLIRSGLLLEISAEQDCYQFGYQDIRDALYRRMPQNTRLHYHRELARIYAKRSCSGNAVEAARAASHFARSGRYRSAYQMFWKAYEESVRDEMFKQGAEYLHRAMELIRRCRYGPNRKTKALTQTGLNLGKLERRFGNFESAVSLLMMVLRLASKTGDSKIAGEVYLNLGAIAGMRGKLPKAARLLGKALKIFTDHDDILNQIDCWTNLGASAAAACRDKEALNYHLNALVLARRTLDRVRLSRCFLNTALSEVTLLMFKNAGIHFHWAGCYAASSGNKRLSVFIQNGKAGMILARGLNTRSARTILGMTMEAIEQTIQIGDFGLTADLLYKQALARQTLNDPRWLSDIKKSYKIAVDLGMTWLAQSIEPLLNPEVGHDRQD